MKTAATARQQTEIEVERIVRALWNDNMTKKVEEAIDQAIAEGLYSTCVEISSMDVFNPQREAVAINEYLTRLGYVTNLYEKHFSYGDSEERIFYIDIAW